MNELEQLRADLEAARKVADAAVALEVVSGASELLYDLEHMMDGTLLILSNAEDAARVETREKENAK